MIGTVIMFVGSLLAIAGFAVFAWFKYKSVPVVFGGMRLEGIRVDKARVVRELDERAGCLAIAGLLTRDRVLAHYPKMTIRFLAPKDGGPSVPYPGGKWKNGTTESPFLINVTWHPDKPTALKYELINALIWQYRGEAMAYAEGQPIRADWDKCQ